MRHSHAPLSDAQNLLRPFDDQHRLAGIMKTMAQRIELLDEDNRQLRAAIAIYREVIRRYDSHGRTLGQLNGVSDYGQAAGNDSDCR